MDESLENIIICMLNDTQEREIAEAKFTEILNTNPFIILQYLTQNILNSPPNIIRRNSTLLYRIIREESIYSQLNNEMFNFLINSIQNILLSDQLDNTSRSLNEDIYFIFAQKNLNENILNCIIQFSTSENPNISTSGINILSSLVSIHAFPDINPLLNFFKIIFDRSLEQIVPQTIPSIRLLRELFITYEIQDLKIYSLRICQFIQTIPKENEFNLLTIISFFPYNYFSECFAEYIGTLLKICMTNESAECAKILSLVILENIIETKHQVLENYVTVIINCILTILTTNDLTEFINETIYLLILILDKLETQELINFLFEVSSTLIQNENPKQRYTALLLYQQIINKVNLEQIQIIINFLLNTLNDPFNICRLYSYKTIGSIHKKKYINECLHQQIFPFLLNAITNETEIGIKREGFKTLSNICKLCGSEVLEIYSQQLLILCFTFGNIIDLTKTIIKLISSIAKSSRQHFLMYYQEVSQFLFQAMQIQNYKIRYAIIKSLPFICKTLKMEIAMKLSEIGINIFFQTELINYTEKQQIKMFKSILKLSKYLNPEILSHINLEPIFNFAKEQLEKTIINANELDLSVTNEKFCKGKIDNEHYLIYSCDKELNISEALHLLSKCINILNGELIEVIFNIVLEHLKNSAISYNIVKSSFDIIESLIVCNNIQIPFQYFFDNIFVLKIYYPKVIPLEIKCLKLLLIRNNGNIQCLSNCIDVSLNIIQNSKERKENLKIISETKNIFDSYIDECEIEIQLAKFCSFVMNNFKNEFMQLNLLEKLSVVFQLNQNDVFNKAALMIFWTNVSIVFQQNINEVALFCVKNLESSFIYVMKQSFKSLSKLIQYTNEIQNVIQIVIQNIVGYLNDDRSKKESYEKVTDNAVVALTYSFIKYPNYQQNDLLHLWLVNLPVYNGDGKMVHKVFADLLKSNMMFFLHDENVESTIEIIATLCRSTWINEETRNCFWEFCKFVFGHEPKLESVYKAADSLSDARKNRLFDFLKTYKSM